MEVTVQEAKTHLSQLLRRVAAGEEIVIRRGSERVAMLVPAPAPAGKRQIWGELSGALHDDFDTTPPEFGEYT